MHARGRSSKPSVAGASLLTVPGRAAIDNPAAVAYRAGRRVLAGACFISRRGGCINDGETEIHGTCASGYEPVREAFAANFAQRDEIGASVAVVVAGRPVVNLWVGWAATTAAA